MKETKNKLNQNQDHDPVRFLGKLFDEKIVDAIEKSFLEPRKEISMFSKNEENYPLDFQNENNDLLAKMKTLKKFSIQ